MKVLISVGELKRRFTVERIIDNLEDYHMAEFNQAFDDNEELTLSEEEWMKLAQGSPKFLTPHGHA